jgi:hypothetical protein
MHSFNVETGRRALKGQFVLAFMFSKLARQAVFDLNVFVFGRVAHDLEIRVLGMDFLILDPNSLLAYGWRAAGIEAHGILCPDVSEPALASLCNFFETN